MIRTFIAFKLPDDIKDELGEVITALKARSGPVKWVRPEGLHVTVKFLGNIDEALTAPLSHELDRVAAAFPPVHVRLSGIGAFPHMRRPRVVYAGLMGDTSIMGEIAAQVDRACTSLGLEPEKRPFKAHITLGRLKLPSVVDSAKEMREKDFLITDVILYKSELSPAGARYVILHRSVLGYKGE